MFIFSINIQISWKESGNTLGDIPKERERKGDKKKRKRRYWDTAWYRESRRQHWILTHGIAETSTCLTISNKEKWDSKCLESHIGISLKFINVNWHPNPWFQIMLNHTWHPHSSAAKKREMKPPPCVHKRCDLTQQWPDYASNNPNKKDIFYWHLGRS